MSEASILRLKMEKTRCKLHRALQDADFNQQDPNVQRISAEFDVLHSEYLLCQKNYGGY